MLMGMLGIKTRKCEPSLMLLDLIFMGCESSHTQITNSEFGISMNFLPLANSTTVIILYHCHQMSNLSA